MKNKKTLKVIVEVDAGSDFQLEVMRDVITASLVALREHCEAHHRNNKMYFEFITNAK